jgi:hypothetical protein
MAYTKEERAAYDRACYLANKEKRAEQMKAWNLANKEKHSEQKKAWYLANKEKRLEQVKAWQKANPEKVAAKNKRYLLKLNLVNKKISIRTLNAWAVQVKEAVPFCEWCYSEDNLEAHHILPKAKFPQHALDLKNGRTMCNYCHTMIHKQGGF